MTGWRYGKQEIVAYQNSVGNIKLVAYEQVTYRMKHNITAVPDHSTGTELQCGRIMLAAERLMILLPTQAQSCTGTMIWKDHLESNSNQISLNYISVNSEFQ